MKDSRHKRSHTAWFYLYEMSRKGRSIYKQISDCLGLGVEIEINCKGVGGSYWDDGNVVKQYGSHGCAKMINFLEIIELHT